MSDELKWQPIETAPKDRYVLLILSPFIPGVGRWLHELGVWSVVQPDDFACFDDPQELWDEYNAAVEYKPTHWMPLPEPPK